jgi:NitT/TauT family transport system ATP-binding protein/nitrate/nitrite transport system substrate-binding protein
MSDASAAPRLRIGVLRLTDAAPVILAQEFGFFADEGIESELLVEPSWANIADKLAHGFLDAAAIMPPLAFALSAGLRGPAVPLTVPAALSLGGNTITFSRAWADKVKARQGSDGPAVALASLLRETGEPLPLGVTHGFSTHHLLLRYWLAAAGIDPDRDVKLTVVPPAGAVEALQTGRIAGFCAGAPWGEVAARAKQGQSVASSRDIWALAPEKIFAVHAGWAARHPTATAGAVRALVRAGQFCDAPENASYTGAVLSRRRYLNVDSHAILSSLPGGAIAAANPSFFFRHAATFPFRSHALWFLHQMRRWNLIPDGAVAAAAAIYRPELYRAAVAPLGIDLPRADQKCEGAHAAAWLLDADPNPIAMTADRFCDGQIFDPGPA